ncbi:hypothetical protein [Trueperella pyogenes]
MDQTRATRLSLAGVVGLAGDAGQAHANPRAPCVSWGFSLESRQRSGSYPLTRAAHMCTLSQLHHFLHRSAPGTALAV